MQISSHVATNPQNNKSKEVITFDTTEPESAKDGVFDEILSSNMIKKITSEDQSEANLELVAKTSSAEVPFWVNPEYSYDVNNPRKPNMRELMEALSGLSMEELYSQPNEDWLEISSQASEILYGVIGSNSDTRDWQTIMSSDNILNEANEQTGLMYKPNVDIVSKFDENNILKEQKAVIKDEEGNILRYLSNEISVASKTLQYFGAKSDSIPSNIKNLTDPDVFDNNLLTFLEKYDREPISVEKVALQTTTKAIANKISQEIPLDELAKL